MIETQKCKDYISVKENIPLEIQDNTIFNIITNNVTAYTHGFHKYPAKFIPHIPKWAIDKYLNHNNGRLILDPFCGSGTTLVEGLLAGHNVIGIDIDPLSVLISKVKTTPINVIILNGITNWLVSEIKKSNDGIFKPECLTIEHWFTKENICKLSLIRTLIDEIPRIFGRGIEIENIQNLLFICFSSIIRRVSNADNESQKTYVSHTNIKIPEEPINLFLNQLNLFKERIIEFSELVNPCLNNQIICTDSAFHLTDIMKNKKIDLVITSPPYIKAIDYIYNQMAELFWIGDLFGMQTQQKQNEKKGEYIGTKHLSKKEYANYSPFDILTGINELDKKLQIIYDNDKKNGHKHSFITYRYFANIEKHLKDMASLMKPNGHYVIVVGNNSVSDVSINTSDFLAQIAERNDFIMINKWGYKIKNRYMRFDRKGRGGIIDIDWVMDFVKK
jgi:DNA modification methylase